MQTQGRISIAALCATAALLVVPTAAGAASLGTVTVKAPSCSKSSTANVTVTATPKGGSTVAALAVARGALSLPFSPSSVLFYLHSVSAKPSISGKVPVGKKITALALFSGGGGETVTKAFTVKKCAAFTG
jgi:hypothetical protein